MPELAQQPRILQAEQKVGNMLFRFHEPQIAINLLIAVVADTARVAKIIRKPSQVVLFEDLEEEHECQTCSGLPFKRCCSAKNQFVVTRLYNFEEPVLHFLGDFRQGDAWGYEVRPGFTIPLRTLRCILFVVRRFHCIDLPGKRRLAEVVVFG